MKRKCLAIVLSIGMIAGLLSGCGGSGSSGGGSSAPADSGSEAPAADSGSEAPAASDTASGDVEEITWMFWDDLNATEDLISLGYKDVIDRFNTDYAGQYHVTVVTTNLEEYYPKLNALVAANETPDVFIVSPGANLTDYVAPGVTADLTSILKDENPDWYASFSGGVFDKQTYDGKIYAVPTNMAAACVFYNTEIFEKAGAEVPTTYDELLDACEKIQAAGYTPITISAGTAWCLSMLVGYLCDREGGPDNLDKINDGTGSWLDPSFLAAGEKMVELSQYFQRTAAGDTNDVATAAFYNEEAGMLIQGSWAIGQINGANPDFEDKCGVFQFPGIPGGADPNRIIAKTDSLAMSSKTEHKDACVALIKYFTDDTAQKYTAEVGGKIPITNVDVDYDKAPAQLKYVMDIMSSTSGTLGFYNESFATSEAGAEFDNQMVSIYLGDQTVEEGFQKVQNFFEEEVWN